MINIQIMAKCKEEAEIIDNSTSLLQALDEKRDAIEEWKNIISKGRELRDIEILDINSMIIDRDTEKAKKIRKKIANRMRKAEQRLWSMKFLTNNVGKGPKQALK